MAKYRFGDIVKEVKEKVDRNNNPYEYFIAGDHMDTDELHLLRRGVFKGSDVGPAFIRIFKPGQVLYGSRRTYLRKVAVADFEGITANTTFVLESKDESILLQRLLPFILQSDRFVQHSIKRSKGSTNPYVLFSDLADYEVDLPAIEKQHEIADLLWAMDEVRMSYKKLIAATDELVKSQFMEQFGDIEHVPDGWKRVSFGDVCNLVNGRAFKPSDWSTTGVPIVRIQNLNDVNADYNYYEGTIEDKYWINDEDLLFAWSGTPGTSFGAFIWDRGKAVLNQHIFRVEPDSCIDKWFLMTCFEGRMDLIISKAHGGVGLRHITKAELEKIEFLLPPMPMQLQYAAFVRQTDKSKFAVLNCIDKSSFLTSSASMINKNRM